QAQAELAVGGGVAGELPLGALDAVGEADLEAGRAEPGSGLRGEFVGGRVGLEAAVCGGDRRWPVVGAAVGRGPVEVARAAVGADAEGVAAGGGGEDGETAGGVEGDGGRRRRHGGSPRGRWWARCPERREAARWNQYMKKLFIYRS